jgi:hypothetical protein
VRGRVALLHRSHVVAQLSSDTCEHD